MSGLTLIHHSLNAHDAPVGLRVVVLRADRTTLAKRRWRGMAGDQREFGFDLAAPLGHGDCFFTEGVTRYVLEQEPEAVVEIPVATPEEAATIAWQIGNLHLGVQVLPGALRVADDPAVAPLLARMHLSHQRHTGVFLPLTGGGGNHYGHAHD